MKLSDIKNVENLFYGHLVELDKKYYDKIKSIDAFVNTVFPTVNLKNAFIKGIIKNVSEISWIKLTNDISALKIKNEKLEAENKALGLKIKELQDMRSIEKRKIELQEKYISILPD